MPTDIPPSILVIDDEPDNFDVIDTLLCTSGYQLHYAPGAQEGLALLETFQPDVILLDVMMPNMNGIEFCRQFKSDPQWRHIPIIMVTALTTKEDLAQCLSAGADDFISKPVSSNELRARVQSMLRIKQQYDDMQMLLGMREDMVNMLVHDLRNPLANILLAAEMLRYPQMSPDKQQKKIEQILQSTQQLRFLIDGLLLMAKLESGQLMLNRSHIDLYELCQAAVDGLEDVAAQKSLQIIPKLPEPGSNTVYVDPALFRRMIDNLLSNAIKFSPRGGQVVLSVEYLETSGARVQVMDSGPGVSESYRQRIFEKYEIGTVIRGVAQTGLGLAFCKIATEAHGGRIAVDDNYPKGSIFTIEIDGTSAGA
jgi:signal transduction histidine kinase